MIFYKLYFTNSEIKEWDRRTFKDYSFRDQVTENCGFFPVKRHDGMVEFDFATEHEPGETDKAISEMIEQVRRVNEHFEFVKIEEITERAFCLDNDKGASNFDYQGLTEVIPTWNFLRQNLGLHRGGWGDSFRDRIIDKSLCASEEREVFKKVTFGRMLEEECRRIRKGKGKFSTPLHYVIRTENTSAFDHTARVLAKEFYDNGRITRRKYTHIYLDDSALDHTGPGVNERDSLFLEKMYEWNKGGLIIVEKRSSDYLFNKETVHTLCNLTNRYQGMVTTLFLVNGADDLADDIESHLHCTYIELTDRIRDNRDAVHYLRARCLESGVVYDPKLLKEYRGNGVHELEDLFSGYRENALGTVFCKEHPEYADLEFFRKKEAEPEKEKVDYHAKLQELIGLQEVKKIIDDMIAFNKYSILRDKFGMAAENPCRHMVFTGNPGTAKTTVARYVAEILAAEHITQSNKFVEVGRSDLVAGYVGWTAKVVKNKFREAKGGVLFIDEAYSLVDEHKGSFGDEAIATIVQEMENNKKDTVVIFAGYRKEMNDFIDRNPGMKSRISFHVDFPDYEVDDLCAIASLMAKNMQLDVSGCGERIHDILSVASTLPNFGNGRYVRNMLEHARLAQATRVGRMKDPTKEDCMTLLPEDFGEVTYTRPDPDPKFGFCA